MSLCTTKYPQALSWDKISPMTLCMPSTFSSTKQGGRSVEIRFTTALKMEASFSSKSLDLLCNLENGLHEKPATYRWQNGAASSQDVKTSLKKTSGLQFVSIIVLAARLFSQLKTCLCGISRARRACTGASKPLQSVPTFRAVEPPEPGEPLLRAAELPEPREPELGMLQNFGHWSLISKS